MKLEAIREDRTRGGRSTYQCSYTLPNSMLSPPLSADGSAFPAGYRGINGPIFKLENSADSGCGSAVQTRQSIPTLLQVCDAKYGWNFSLEK